VTVYDIHPHVLAADTERYPLAPIGGTLSGWAATRPVTTPELLAAMDDAGIDKAVLVQASTAYGYDNSYVTDSSRDHPQRLLAIGCFDPLAADAPARLEREVVDNGLVGARLFTTGSTMPDQADWLAAPGTHPFWQAAGELGVPVCVQMRLPGTDQLENVLQRFPDTRLLLDHMAYPATDADGAAHLAPLAKYPNLFLKMTIRNTGPLAESPDPSAFLDPLLAAFGSDRIAWGSNYPAVPESPAALLRTARTALTTLSAPALDDIFCRTAATLYPRLAG
jgi:L-fuconolactonase